MNAKMKKVLLILAILGVTMISSCMWMYGGRASIKNYYLYDPLFEKNNKHLLDNQVIRVDGHYEYKVNDTYYQYIRFFYNGLMSCYNNIGEKSGSADNVWGYGAYVYKFENKNKIIFADDYPLYMPEDNFSHKGDIRINNDTLIVHFEKSTDKYYYRKYIFVYDSLALPYPKNKVRGIK